MHHLPSGRHGFRPKQILSYLYESLFPSVPKTWFRCTSTHWGEALRDGKICDDSSVSAENKWKHDCRPKFQLQIQLISNMARGRLMAFSVQAARRVWPSPHAAVQSSSQTAPPLHLHPYKWVTELSALLPHFIKEVTLHFTLNDLQHPLERGKSSSSTLKRRHQNLAKSAAVFALCAQALYRGLWSDIVTSPTGFL